jgi:hypothetical protein
VLLLLESRCLSLARRRCTAAVLLSALLPLLVLSCGCGNTESSHGSPPTDAATGRAPLRVSRSFNALRGPRGELPAGPIPIGTDSSATRGWPVLQTLKRETWAILLKGRLCLVDNSDTDGISIACRDIGYVLQDGILSTFLRDEAFDGPRRRSVVGLVPDQAKRVRVHTPGFPTVTRPVERNVFVLTDHIPQPPETIELLPGR